METQEFREIYDYILKLQQTNEELLKKNTEYCIYIEERRKYERCVFTFYIVTIVVLLLFIISIMFIL